MLILKRIMILVFPPLFFIGLWWGLRETKLQHEKQGQFGPVVKIQLLRGFVQPEILNLWSRKAQVTLEPVWIDETRDLLSGYENPALDILLIPSFHAHPSHITDLITSVNSKALKSVLSRVFVDFLFEPSQPQFLTLIPVGWNIQTLFCPTSQNKWSSQTLTYSKISQITGHKIRVRQNASELITILLRSQKIQPEWVTPEQSDLLKSEITQMKNEFEIVHDMQIISKQENCWFDSLALKDKYKDFAQPLWTQEQQSLWVYYLGLKNKDKQGLFESIIEAFYSKEVQSALAEKTEFFSPLKDSSWSEKRDSRLLSQIPLDRIRILRGQPEGETIWDKVIEMALENQPSPDEAPQERDSMGLGDD